VVRYLVRDIEGVIVSVTASEARQRLFPLIEEVNDDQVAVEIVSKKGTAYLVSADEYRSLKETVYLLQSPRNAERLRESIAELHAGGAQERDLIE
jgi:antitoxin YefM